MRPHWIMASGGILQISILSRPKSKWSVLAGLPDLLPKPPWYATESVPRSKAVVGARGSLHSDGNPVASKHRDPRSALCLSSIAGPLVPIVPGCFFHQSPPQNEVAKFAAVQRTDSLEAIEPPTMVFQWGFHRWRCGSGENGAERSSFELRVSKLLE